MNDIATAYRERAERFSAEIIRLGGIDRLLARGRIVAFLVAIGIFLVAWLGGGGRVWYLAGALAIIAFVALVGYHEHLERLVNSYRSRRRINLHCLARMSRDWDELPVPSVAVPSKRAAVAKDLDLFGQGSLFQFINRADTQRGQEVLRDWLLVPAEPEEIKERQPAVRTLTPGLELREEFNLHGSLVAESRSGPSSFIAWADSEPWLEKRSWLLWTARILPAIFIAAVVLAIGGVIGPNVGGFTAVGVIVINAAISVAFTGSAHDIFNSVSTRHGEVGRYVKMFELMYEIPDSTNRLAAIKQEVTLQDRSALKHLTELNRIVWLARISHHPFFFIVYLLVQPILLWDFHVLASMETWQRRYGKFARSWFDALGEFEALASLASLAHDNPNWCFANVHEDHDRLAGTAVGHPLLEDEERVDNNVEVGPGSTFLLVTGSNMSGKSTLLRSLGINAVLAQAGGPVCASGWTMPPLTVATSMRISDSLQDHVSFFMAELRRLKEIVDQATEGQQTNRQLLFLLDEILQGTNSTERHIAVVEVLSHLLESGAFGAVSTHDLELAKSDSLADLCTAVHFRETLHGSGSGESMTFDYQLRDGIAPTTNALKLLELVGLRERKSVN
jgi:hypothetical protein